jgi:transcriptional regulator with XRE-family HTH domain
MTVSLKEMMEKLPPARRKAIEKRAAELIAQEATLRGMREAFALTQEHVAKRMRVGQETVSRIEGRRKDLRLSTLRNYVSALGGDLELVARFPEGPITVLDLSSVKPPAKRRGNKSKPARTAA